MSPRGWRVPVAAGLILASVVGTHSEAAPARASAKSAAKASAPHQILPFISDDYSRALAEARARRVPIFVEAWAPW